MRAAFRLPPLPTSPQRATRSAKGTPSKAPKMSPREARPSPALVAATHHRAQCSRASLDADVAITQLNLKPAGKKPCSLEVTNNADVDITLDGWSLNFKAGPSGGVAFRFPDLSPLRPGKFLWFRGHTVRTQVTFLHVLLGQSVTVWMWASGKVAVGDRDVVWDKPTFSEGCFAVGHGL